MSRDPRGSQYSVPVSQAVQGISAGAPPEEAAARAPETDMLALVYARSIVDTVREPLLVLDNALHVRTASRSFYNIFEVAPEETQGRFVYDLGNGQWNIPALRTLLDEVLTKNKNFHDYEVRHNFPARGRASDASERPEIVG